MRKSQILEHIFEMGFLCKLFISPKLDKSHRFL